MSESNNNTSNEFRIETIEQVKHLWLNIYKPNGKPDWSHIIPYYDENIQFRDSVQELHGIEAFKAMTDRLAARSNNLKMHVVNATKDKEIVFVEWEMTISFKKRPSSVIYGASRLTINDKGKIIKQKDYYDLWGDIFDNIPRFGKAYRKFMHRKFG